MKLSEILNEVIDLTKGKKNPELEVPVYTTNEYDFGSKSNKISTNDVVVKDTNTGTIYGRRQIKQRTLKKGKSKNHNSNWQGMKKI